jgi:hypothetical protein
MQTLNEANDDLRDEYDLSEMVVLPRGRFAPERRLGKNVRLLDADVMQAFPDDKAVNEALRMVMKMAELPRRPLSSELSVNPAP